MCNNSSNLTSRQFPIRCTGLSARHCSEVVYLNKLNVLARRFPLIHGWTCLIQSSQYFINAQQHIPALMKFHFRQHMIEFL